MYITGTSYTDFFIYLPKESTIVRVKKETCYANVSVPLLKKFFYDSIVPEILQKMIHQKYVCKDVLDDLLDNVVQATTDNEKVQYELNQLTLPPPFPPITVTPLKRKLDHFSNAVRPSKKK